MKHITPIRMSYWYRTDKIDSGVTIICDPGLYGPIAALFEQGRELTCATFSYPLTELHVKIRYRNGSSRELIIRGNVFYEEVLKQEDELPTWHLSPNNLQQEIERLIANG